MADCGFWGEFIKFAANGVVIGTGWFVVHRLTVTRENEKARKDLVGKVTLELHDALTKLFDAAHEYHLKERDIGREMSLKVALKDFSQSVHALQYTVSDQRTVLVCLRGVIALRRAITGNHFEDEHFGPLDLSASQFSDIADAVSFLKNEFVTLRHRQFSPGGRSDECRDGTVSQRSSRLEVERVD